MKVNISTITIIAERLTAAMESLFSSSRQKRLQDAKEQVLKETENADFSSFTHEWGKTKPLYDELKKKCHPDKYNKELKEEATRIFQMVVENRYKYKNLLKIKEEAVRVLGID